MTLGCAVAVCEERHPANGLVLKIDTDKKLAMVSCKDIPGYTAARTMWLHVPDAKDLANTRPGTMIDFVLVPDREDSHMESVRAHIYQGLEPDPAAARRLKLLSAAANRPLVKPIAIGDAIPDFTLIGQDDKPISSSQLRGKVVALNFIYTRCALPNYCLRSSNNFGELQKRFKNEMSRNLVLMTVTFDPVHDSAETMAKYARRWNADPQAWHFLTGSEAAIRRVCDLFGEDYFPDEGLMDHSLHTAVIDRTGHLVANLEGNEFSAQQLGDLVQAVLGKSQ